jgi:hypothetical protein
MLSEDFVEYAKHTARAERDGYRPLTLEQFLSRVKHIRATVWANSIYMLP